LYLSFWRKYDIDNATVIAYSAPTETWLDKRLKSLADGGYGTVAEQLEMASEEGFDYWQKHILAVKKKYKK